MTTLTHKHIDSEQPPKVVSEALSDDAYKRGVELAFYDRVVRSSFTTSARNLRLVSARNSSSQDNEVVARLREHRSPVFARLARAMENDVPPAPDFGKFRSRDR